MRFNLEEVKKMFNVKGSKDEKKLVAESQENGSALAALKRHNNKSSVGKAGKGTLGEIWDTPEEIKARTKEMREKYGWPEEENSLEALRQLKNNPPVHGTTQRGTTVTTSGEDEQTFPMEKSADKDCGCNGK
jgi:hypothetical protein